MVQLPSEAELLFCCLCDGVSVVSSGQVLADVNPEGPEAADSLHHSPVDGDGSMSISLSLPAVHNHLLCFADVDTEVVVMAPRRQDSDLLSAGDIIAVGDGCVISELNDGVGAVGGRAVVRKRAVGERGLSTQP